MSLDRHSLAEHLRIHAGEAATKSRASSWRRCKPCCQPSTRLPIPDRRAAVRRTIAGQLKMMGKKQNAPREGFFKRGAYLHLEAEVGIEPAYADLQSAA